MNDAFENTFKQFMEKNTAKTEKLSIPASKGFPSGKTDSGNDGKSQYNFLNSSSKEKGTVKLRPITIEEV